MDQLKTADYGTCYSSPSFGEDDNFCLVCFPNGYKPERVGSLSLGIRLLKLPNNVSRIVISYKLKAGYDGDDPRSFYVQGTKGISYSNPVTGWRNGTFDTEILNTIQSKLVFGADIEVEEIYDMNDQIINKSKWWGKYTCDVPYL